MSSLRAYGKQHVAAREEVDGSPGPQMCTARLAVLLQLYGSVVHVNATCTSLHPQVLPLVGMAMRPGANSDVEHQVRHLPLLRLDGRVCRAPIHGALACHVVMVVTSASRTRCRVGTCTRRRGP